MDLMEYWWNIGNRTFIFLRKTFIMMIILHMVSVIIVDVPIQNVKIVLTYTDIMAQGAQEELYLFGYSEL